MALDTKRKEKEQEQEESIRRARREKNFLPAYSTYYFAKRKEHEQLWIFVFCYYFLIALPTAVTQNFRDKTANGFLLLGVFWFLYIFLLRKAILAKKRLAGAFLYEDGIHKRNLFGRERLIPYEKLEQQIQNGAIRYADTGLAAGKGRSKLVFHYEIGKRADQKHIKQCLSQLQRHISVELPPYEEEILELVDRRYYYNKRRRTQGKLLLAAVILTGIILSQGVHSPGLLLFVCLLIYLWEMLSLFTLFKNAFLMKNNNEKIVEALAKFPCVSYNRFYKLQGFFWYALSVAAVAGVNLWMIVKY